MTNEIDWNKYSNHSDKNTFIVKVNGQEYRYVAEYQEEPPEDPEDRRGMEKIFHYVIDPEGNKHTMDWTPYSKPSEEEVSKWIKMGMPERFGHAPIDSEQLAKAGVMNEGTEESEEDNTLSESFVSRLRYLAGIDD